MPTDLDFAGNSNSKTSIFPRARRDPIIKFNSLHSEQEKKQTPNESGQKLPDKSIITHARERESEAIGNPAEGQTFGDRLEELFDNPNEVVMSISTVFPFDLFPDEVRIDPLKIQIVKRKFFGCSQIHHLLIKDIDDVFVETAPFFATLKIINGHDKEHPIRIAPLKKNDAKKAGKMIEGLIIGRSEASDISKVEAIR